MRKVIIILICCNLGTLYAQELNSKKKDRFNGFSGGMSVHCGYLSAGTPIFYDLNNKPLQNPKISGAPFGLGGVLKLHIGEHFRIGGEGYGSTLVYGKTKNRWSLSWGGLLMDCHWQQKRWTWFAGHTLGFGSVRHLLLFDANTTDFVLEKQSTYRKYSVIMLVPFTGVEFAISPKMALSLKLDYTFNVLGKKNDFAKGLRVYFGFIFKHIVKQETGMP